MRYVDPAACCPWCRARREGDASLPGSEASSVSSCSSGAAASCLRAGSGGRAPPEEGDGGFGALGAGVLHGASDALSNVYFSYSGVADASYGSPGKRPGTGGRMGSPLAGRPRTAALAARQALRRPISSALAAAQWG